MSKTKFLLLLAVLLCGTTTLWAEDPAWLKSGDSWDEVTKTLTVNSNPDNAAYVTNSEIQKVVIAASVTTIKASVFAYCLNLKSVTIGEGVTSIGLSAFSGCSALTAITVASGNANYKSVDGVLFSKDGKTLMLYPIGKTGDTYTIPSSVTSIGEGAFNNCSGLTSITIPSSVTSIGEYAFNNCSGLTSITIPSSVTSISDYAFSGCDGLTSITIPSSVTSIGEYAFEYCSSLTSITIPSSVTSIGIYAFSSCEGLTSITIPSSVTSISDHAFSSCVGLTSVTIPSGVTSIGEEAFSGCYDLTSITIPSSVTSIGLSAFSGCSSLTSLIIPSSVTSIGTNAFMKCTGMTDVYFYAATSVIWHGPQDFNSDSNTKFHVKKGESYVDLQNKVRATFVADLIGDAPLKANQGDNPGEYWATYYHNSTDHVKVGGSTEVYKAELGVMSVKLTQITDGIINKSAAVILKSTEPEILVFSSDSGTAADEAYSGNELDGVEVETAQDPESKYYVLSTGSAGVGFYVLQSGVNLGAHKAYLSVPVSSGARAFYGFGEDGNATEIYELPVDTEPTDSSWYDLSGHRLAGKPAAKGIYVKNGRKYLLK